MSIEKKCRVSVERRGGGKKQVFILLPSNCFFNVSMHFVEYSIKHFVRWKNMHLFKTKYYTQHNLNMLFLFKVPLTILKEIYFLSKVVISCFSFSAGGDIKQLFFVQITDGKMPYYFREAAKKVLLLMAGPLRKK